MRKLQKTKGKTNFPIAFYKSVAFVLFLLGVFLLLLGYFLSESYFLKFTINNKLTLSALQKIKILKISLVISGFIVLALVIVLKLYKKRLLKFIVRKKVLLQNLTLFLLSILIVVILLELGIRLALTKEAKYNFPPGVPKFYEKYVFLNKEGYRDTEHSYNKAKNNVRIIGLGDSFTFGTGIKNVDDLYLKKLEKLLNEKSNDKNYEVLNFGKAGVDTEFEIKILKNDALNYKPDIIMVGYLLNDFRDFETQKKGTNPYLFWFDIFLKRYSYLYNFASKGFNIGLESLGLKKSYYQSIVDSFNSENNKKLNSEYFKELKKISKANNAKLVIVILPFIYQLDNYPFAEQHKIVTQIGSENDLIVIDLLPYFENIDENKIIVSKYDNHPNELGHEIAAKALYEKLIKLKLVP